MSGLAVLPVLESEKQAIDQGHLHGLFASKLFLPPEMLDELLRTATDLWRSNGCDPRLIELAMEAARAAYRGEVSWLSQLASLSGALIADLTAWRAAKLLVDQHGPPRLSK